MSTVISNRLCIEINYIAGQKPPPPRAVQYSTVLLTVAQRCAYIVRATAKPGKVSELYRGNCDSQSMGEEQKPVLKTFQVGTNSLFALLKERVRPDLKCLKNQLQKP